MNFLSASLKVPTFGTRTLFRKYGTSRVLSHRKGVFGVEGLHTPHDWVPLAKQSCTSIDQTLNELKNYRTLSPSKVLYTKVHDRYIFILSRHVNF